MRYSVQHDYRGIDGQSLLFAGRKSSKVRFDRRSAEAAEAAAAESSEGEVDVRRRWPGSPSAKATATLRAVFDRWREYSVRRATGHTGRAWQSNDDGDFPALFD